MRVADERREALPWMAALAMPLLLGWAMGMPAPSHGAGLDARLLTVLANASFAMLSLSIFGTGWFGVDSRRPLGATLMAAFSLPMGLLALSGFALQGGLPLEMRGGPEAANWHWWLAHALLPLALGCAAATRAQATVTRRLRLGLFLASWVVSLALLGALRWAGHGAAAGPWPPQWPIVLLNVVVLGLCLACQRAHGHGPALWIAAALATLSELCAAASAVQLAAPVYIVLAQVVMLLAVHHGSFEQPLQAIALSHRKVLARKAAVQAVLGAMSDAMLAVDPCRRVSVVNLAGCRLLGLEAPAIEGQDAGELLQSALGEAGELLLRDIDAVLRTGTAPRDAERMLRLGGGQQELVFERRVMPVVDADGGVGGAVLLLRDVSERRGLVERLRDANGYVRSLLDSSPNPMLVVDPDGAVVDLNPAVTRLTGREREALVGQECAGLFGDPDGIRAALRHALAGGSVQDLVQALVAADGAPAEVLCNTAPSRNARGEVKGAFVVVRDAAGLRGDGAPPLELQACDALTTLPNRRLFRDRLEEALFRSRRSGRPGAVLFIDLDNFKDVNDALGHTTGDELLRVVARRLDACLRGSDILARIGGDEFALLAEHLAEPEDARQLAERLLAAVREPVLIAGAELVVSCSVGVSVFPLDLGGADTLLRNADTAMFRAKDAGKNNCQFFTFDMSRAVRRRVEIRTQLRNAIRQGEFSLVYQPRMAARSDQLAGAEALLRWRSAELGVVGPQEFIPVAEEAGLIVPIGEWVLRQACAQAMRWRETSGREVPVAVNISARQFRDTDIVQTVTAVLAETGLPSQLLELELTESVLMRDTSRAVDTLRRLSALGVRVALDDFGTGYSSLSYLKRFPLDYLKVDKSFVADINGDLHDEAIVKTIVALAHGLGMRVVAEGVETPEQLACLRRLGCDEVQGYLLGRPVPPEQLLARLQGADAGTPPVNPPWQLQPS